MLRVFIGLVMLLCAFDTHAQTKTNQTEKPGWLGQAKAWVSEKFNHEDASDWLKRIGPALRKQNYQGTFVMVAEGRIETMAVYHTFKNDRERERIVALSGPAREVIRDNKVVVSTNSKDGSVGYDADTTDRWNPTQQFALADNLDGYEAKLGKAERIANFETQVVELGMGCTRRLRIHLLRKDCTRQRHIHPPRNRQHHKDYKDCILRLCRDQLLHQTQNQLRHRKDCNRRLRHPHHAASPRPAPRGPATGWPG